MNEHTAYEKFRNAVEGLASGTMPLPERLISAWIIVAPLYGESPDVFARQPELRNRFDEVHRQLTREKPTHSAGSVQATAGTLSDDEASRIARDIFEIFCDVAECEQ